MTTQDRFSLAGRVALVTGAASGLGRAIAIGFAEAGARVRCVDRDAAGNDDVARSIGEPADSVTADVTDAEAVAAAIDGLVAEARRIDVVVNSAGVGGRSPAVDYPEDLWASVMEINLRGTYLACRAAGRHMVAAGSGSIINIASVGGLAGFPGSLGYQASKGGVVALTRTLAIEWAPQGVRVNAIAPVAVRVGRRAGPMGEGTGHAGRLGVAHPAGTDRPTR